MIGEEREGRLESIPVGRLRAPSETARRAPADEEIRRLAASIKKHGLLHPILVRPSGRQYEIVCGWRRYLACKALGIGKVTAVVRILDNRQAFEIALAENARREHLSPAERQETLRRLAGLFPGRDSKELEAWMGPGVAETETALPDWVARIPETETAIPTTRRPESEALTEIDPRTKEASVTAVGGPPAMTRRRLVLRVRSVLKTLDETGHVDLPLLNGIVEELLAMFGRLELVDFLDLRYWEKPRKYVPRHCLNVAKLAIYLARELGLPPEETEVLATAALVHDVGMVRVKDLMLTKKAFLDEAEWNRVKDHPVGGALLVTKEEALRDVIARVVLEHQEKSDGPGYPEGKKGAEIHRYARIINVVDTFEAVCSPRAHRFALLPYQAIQVVLEEGSKGTLDWEIVQAFIKAMSIYPIGSYLKLESGEIGRVVRANPEDLRRPVLEVVADAQRNRLPEPRLLDLLTLEPPPTLEPIPAPL